MASARLESPVSSSSLPDCGERYFSERRPGIGDQVRVVDRSSPYFQMVGVVTGVKEMALGGLSSTWLTVLAEPGHECALPVRSVELANKMQIDE